MEKPLKNTRKKATHATTKKKKQNYIRTNHMRTNDHADTLNGCIVVLVAHRVLQEDRACAVAAFQVSRRAGLLGRVRRQILWEKKQGK